MIASTNDCDYTRIIDNDWTVTDTSTNDWYTYNSFKYDYDPVYLIETHEEMRSGWFNPRKIQLPKTHPFVSLKKVIRNALPVKIREQ